MGVYQRNYLLLLLHYAHFYSCLRALFVNNRNPILRGFSYNSGP